MARSEYLERFARKIGFYAFNRWARKKYTVSNLHAKAYSGTIFATRACARIYLLRQQSLVELILA